IVFCLYQLLDPFTRLLNFLCCLFRLLFNLFSLSDLETLATDSPSEVYKSSLMPVSIPIPSDCSNCCLVIFSSSTSTESYYLLPSLETVALLTLSKGLYP